MRWNSEQKGTDQLGKVNVCRIMEMKLQSSLETLDECRRMFNNFTLQLSVLCCEDSCVPPIHFLGRWMVAEPLWAWWQAEPQEAEKSQHCRMSCILLDCNCLFGTYRFCWCVAFIRPAFSA